MYDVSRFIRAQDKVYRNVLNELKKGKKVSHWMWYIFPQLKELGYSDTAIYYGIENLVEAKEYVNNEILYQRYIECCNILLDLKKADILEVLGEIDSLKLKSSLTLFYYADQNNRNIYMQLLKKYYDGKMCVATCDILNTNIKRSY